ncbi:S41 family peptidase [uncultured Rikenella sp.]|uniref:S41 family peptidase n=1 Tax=uncultured Rikenella sp. TaxID=368003 RepID=UPI0026069559|nr:S41 family peptidase [uncultured Rikenella sp.]
MKYILKTIIIAAAFALGSAAHAQKISSQQAAQFQKINQVMYLIANGYVDSVDMVKLVEGAISQMLGSLDPHSVYIGPEELKEQEQEIEGNFEGIGIEFNVLRDTIVVVNTVPGGPSEQVGLMSGDRIVYVNGELKTKVRLNDVPKFLRGPKGTRAELRIVRPGVADTLDFSIVRDKIPMYSLDAAYRVDRNTGYVKLNRFMATTNDELRKALDGMQGISSLILDLRGNGGGLLEQSIRVAGNFLKPNSLVVYTEGLNMSRQEAHTAPSEPLFGSGKLIVLVDESSASASEIVAGAMQDWDRGTVVGRRTFGKGLVQQQIPLSDGSAIRLTVAHYYTPSGRSIQRPYERGNFQGYYNDWAKRYSSGELTGGKAPAADSSHVYKTLVEGRNVYGGGGITPDVYVPLDTTAYSDYWSALVRRGVLLEFAVTELDSRRQEYREKYPDFDTFARDFVLTPEMTERLIALGRARGVEYDEKGMERSRRPIGAQIKALIAQRLWNTTAYYRVINAENDPDFAAAVAEAGK